MRAIIKRGITTGGGNVANIQQSFVDPNMREVAIFGEGKSFGELALIM